MSHLHIVHDSDAHFTIDPVTRAIKNESGKVTVIQHDHNSERFTFSIQKQVEGHDMSVCNRVEIHYINIDATDKTQKATGVYEADDLKTSSDDNGKVTFSWLLSRNATQYAGSLNFLIRFACITDGVEEYAWNTAIYQSITVGSGMYNGGEEVIEPYLDVIAQWKNDLFGVGDTQEQRLLTVSAEQQAAIAAKGAAVLDSIPDEYEALQTGVDTLFNSVASGIRGNLSGSVIRADDVSPVGHEMTVKVTPTNFVPLGFSNKSEEIERQDDGGVKFTSAGVLNDDYREIRISTTGDSKVYLDKGIYSFKLFNAPIGAFMIISGQAISYQEGVEGVFTVTEAGYMDYIIVRFAAGYSYDCVVYPMICKGETATEYTPYIDPETVKVVKCVKNLLAFKDSFSMTQGGVTLVYDNEKQEFTINGTGSAESPVNFQLGSLMAFKPYIGEGVSMTVSLVHESGSMVGEKEDVDVWWYVTYMNVGSAALKLKNQSTSKTFSLSAGQFGSVWLYVKDTVVFTDYKFKVQIEVGETASEFELYNHEKYTPGADGFVPGLTSVSPTMTIMTDTPGVTVDCEYIVDTKTYIDNKIKELMEGVTA